MFSLLYSKVILLYCKKIEFKDKEKKPIFGIIVKEDKNYVWFKTRNKESRISHDEIGFIEDTNIIFENNDGSVGDNY